MEWRELAQLSQILRNALMFKFLRLFWVTLPIPLKTWLRKPYKNTGNLTRKDIVSIYTQLSNPFFPNLSILNKNYPKK